MRFFSIFLFSLIWTTCTSQVSFAKGYILNLKGDTVKGELKVPRKEADHFDKVSFKDEKGIQKSYDSDKIRGFGYRDVEFVVLPLDGENLFFRVLEKGHITLYKQMFPAFRMNKESWETEYYLLDKETGKPELLNEARYRRQLARRMEDKSDFLAAYNEREGFDPIRVQEVIRKYNAWKSSGKP